MTLLGELRISEKINDKDPQADFRKYLEIVFPPDCPVELIDLSVRMNPKDPSLRDVRFKVRNRSKEAMTRFSFQISTRGEEGSLGVGTSLKAKPGEIVDGPDNLDYLGYVFCEGEQHRRLVVDSVRFADDTQWELRTRQGKHNGRRYVSASHNNLASTF